MNEERLATYEEPTTYDESPATDDEGPGTYDDGPVTDTGGKRRCRPAPPEGECDASSAIDDRRCRDEGLTAQLAYTKEHGPALDEAQKTYDQARKDYREKRHEAALKVADMKHQVKHLLERIKCLIEQDRVVRYLDEAFCEVAGRLDCCEGPTGCTVSEFDFDRKPPEDSEKGDRKLAQRIERYKAEIKKAKDGFDALAREPANIATRVDEVKKDLDAILAALADDAAKVDLKKQYANALLAQRKLARRHIWNGFEDTSDYVACLCTALSTWTDGVEVVSLLVGEEAVRKCADVAEKQWCERLIGGPVAEIFAVYDRLSGTEKPCGTDKPEQPEDDHSEDCGCGKHKHHDHGEEPHPEQAQGA